jgi:hypothetical protein
MRGAQPNLVVSTESDVPPHDRRNLRQPRGVYDVIRAFFRGKQGGEDRSMILCEANCCEIVVPEDSDAQRHQDVLSLCEESQPYDCCRFV